MCATKLTSKHGFQRYNNLPEADCCCIRMPVDDLKASVSNLSVGEVIGRFEKFSCGEDYHSEMFPWAKRFVMGFPLPDWQRPLVWNIDQKLRFISSMWLGIDIGSYMVNDLYELRDGVYREFSDILLDGQQRLSTIEAYLINEFPLPDVKGVPRYWDDLPIVERRRFCAITFARSTIKTWDEKSLRMAYDLRAFGGTSHAETQRAFKRTV